MRKPYAYKGLREELGVSSSDYRKIYDSWRRMIGRCFNPNNASYEHYQKRGITVCDEWKNSFEPFLRWSVISGWDERLSLDRINNDKNYSPDNCRWADFKTQGNNRSTCRFISHNGETKSLMQWCEQFGIPHYLAMNRIRRGDTNFESIFSPEDKRRRCLSS